MAVRKKAFTLVELVLIVLFLGIFTAITIPRLNFAAVSKQKVECLVTKIVTDLRHTRTRALNDAATNTAGFALNMLGTAPYASYKIINLDTEATVDSYTIDSDIDCTGGDQFEFEPSGELSDASDTEVNISADGTSFTITILPTTGMVKYTED